MAKKKPPNPDATPYTLYTRCDPGREPKRLVPCDVSVEGHVVGNDVMLVPRWGYRRGALVTRFQRYKDLVAYAQDCCEMIGIPKSRWVDIFDWNK